MNFFASVLISTLVLGCGQTQQKSKNIIGNDLPAPQKTTVREPTIPLGAIRADFNGDSLPFYGYVKNIDQKNETTTIGFEKDQYPPITIPESIGAELQILKLQNFDRDLLLVNAKLKDTSFNEYYLFKLQNSSWQLVMDRFDIHKTNMNDTLMPIQVDPNDSTKLLRYYSAFEMDRKSEKKFSWKLMQESILVK